MKKTATFIFIWFLIFAITYAALSYAKALPAELQIFNALVMNKIEKLIEKDPITDKGSSESDTTENDLIVQNEIKESVLPESVEIPKIGVSVRVMNPVNPDTAVLDAELLKGVVRYPGSGGLDDDTNMLLFGHSTRFREVKNDAFQAFNRLEELRIGDTIKVKSGGGEYIYKVTLVSQVSSDKALVNFRTGEKMITLSTCDSFGSKQDRIVVEAKFIGTIGGDNS
jgi:sortase A